MDHQFRYQITYKTIVIALFLDRGAVTEQFQQMCIFPRSTFSVTDAIFCAKFIHLLHKLKVPNLSTLNLYDFVRFLEKNEKN